VGEIASSGSILGVQPRAISRLLGLRPDRRLDAIAEGLGLIAEHAATLDRDVRQLAEIDGNRGAVILNAIAEEEAAKALILLDLVRAGAQDQKTVARQLKRFSDHLARCIYVELAAMRPATFREARDLVDIHRVDYFLDGPSDGDWIFRNRLLEQREQSMYVDYVHTEESDEWRTPATANSGPIPALFSSARDLVASLHSLGALTRNGLDIIVDVWDDVTLSDDTHWQAERALNVEAVERICTNLPTPPGSVDIQRVVETWGFPLVALNLDLKRIRTEELEAERDRRLADWAEY
jgi:AbiV family abortive infection protein